MLIKKKEELTDKGFRDRLLSKERKILRRKEKKDLIMFIGDRGAGARSTIKEHTRYGGEWKQRLHSQYTNIVITNENKTAQTCVYCFSHIRHPKYRITRNEKKLYININGSFLCINPKCISVILGEEAVQSRDSVSAISGSSKLLFQETLLWFSLNKTSQFNTGTIR